MSVDLPVKIGFSIKTCMKGGVTMKGTSRKRTLLVSCAVILLCMTVIIGMTWALFTDTHTVKNHLKAGDLDITLERIGF